MNYHLFLNPSHQDIKHHQRQRRREEETGEDIYYLVVWRPKKSHSILVVKNEPYAAVRSKLKIIKQRLRSDE